MAGKKSSPSSIAYWKRHPTKSRKALDRHLHRMMRKMGKTSPADRKDLEASATAGPNEYPKIHNPRPLSRVVLTDTIGKGPFYPLFQLYVEGVLVESSGNLSACMAYPAAAWLPRVIYKLHDSGRRELISVYDGRRENLPLAA